mgnify:CR=1 FL=1
MCVSDFRVVAFTHRTAGMEELGQFCVEEGLAGERLENIRRATGARELLFLSTCNRVEFFLLADDPEDEHLADALLKNYKPEWEPARIEHARAGCLLLRGTDALQHLFRVACSLDSLVVGEREISAQIRTAYDRCREQGLTGDFMRIAVRGAQAIL